MSKGKKKRRCENCGYRNECLDLHIGCDEVCSVHRFWYEIKREEKRREKAISEIAKSLEV